MKNIINWFKTLFRIVRDYDTSMATMDGKVNHSEFIANNAVAQSNQSQQFIKDRTDMHISGGYKASHCDIIVIGRYKHNDFVETYRVSQDQFHEFVYDLELRRKHHNIDRIDAPPAMREVIKRADRKSF